MFNIENIRVDAIFNFIESRERLNEIKKIGVCEYGFEKWLIVFDMYVSSINQLNDDETMLVKDSGSFQERTEIIDKIHEIGKEKFFEYIKIIDLMQ